MPERRKAYARKEKIPMSEAMSDALNSRALQEYLGTNDKSKMVEKMLDRYMKIMIEHGDLENVSGKEEIYRLFNTRPKTKTKELVKT